jgi:SNF2 family DNA or RNA helicase
MMLDIVETFVQSCGYSYLRMDGNTAIRQVCGCIACLPCLNSGRCSAGVCVIVRRQRQRLVDQFNEDPACFIFLLTTKVMSRSQSKRVAARCRACEAPSVCRARWMPQVGGLGINLTGANCVMIFDPDVRPR